MGLLYATMCFIVVVEVVLCTLAGFPSKFVRRMTAKVMNTLEQADAFKSLAGPFKWFALLSFLYVAFQLLHAHRHTFHHGPMQLEQKAHILKIQRNMFVNGFALFLGFILHRLLRLSRRIAELEKRLGDSSPTTSTTPSRQTSSSVQSNVSSAQQRTATTTSSSSSS
eukprot:m.354652 g.354652  ORF g.354652 m.354652 type:complete len:167 (-) comp17071_c0_seq1:1744-2244(-)